MFAVLALLCSGLIFCVRPGACSIQNVFDVQTESDSNILRERWLKVDENFSNMVSTILKQVLPMLVRAQSEGLEINDDCTDSLMKMVFAVQRQEMWAYKMLDAMGKPPSGVLMGSLTSLGSFFECIQIRVPENGPEEFRGRYCHVDLRTPLPPKPRFYRIDNILEELKDIPIKNDVIGFIRNQSANFYLLAMRYGICLPSVCSKDDVNHIAQTVGKYTGFNVDVPHCEVEEEIHVDDQQIIVISVLGSAIALVILGTAIHICTLPPEPNKNAGLPSKLVYAFSLVSNISKLVSTTEGPDTRLAAFHGIKFISIVWIILGHTYLYVNWQIFEGLTNVFDYIRDLPFQTIMNASVAVDTFFFISALLSAYISTQFVDKYGVKAYNIPVLIIRRIWRLLPLALVAASLMILLPLAGSGPIWHETMDRLIQCCRDNWWAILIFGNNFLYPGNMCLQHTWYISCDLQLHIVGCFFLLLLFRNPKYGAALGGFLVVINISVTAFVTYWFQHPPTTLVANIDVSQRLEIFQYNYFLPHSHIGIYAMGLLMGYYLAKHKTIRIPWFYQILGWIWSIGCCLSVLYVVQIWSIDHPPILWESALYSSLRGVTWAAGLAWLALALATGHGGLVNRFLSWKAFLPMSRLTYGIYLLHFMVIWTFIGSLGSTIEARHFFAVMTFFGYVCVTTLLAFLCRIFFEAPLQELEKIVLTIVFGKKLEKLENNSQSKKTDQCETKEKANGECAISRL